MKRVLTFLLAVMAAAGTISAKITLPEIIGDNMVLQQDTKVRIWGKASAGKTVTITTSWSREKTKVTADGDGNWLALVQTPAASYTRHSMVISDGEAVKLDNILIGEVWFLSLIHI